MNRLRLTVLQRLDGLLTGDHAGLFPGHGTERAEARPYVAGDDPRYIDWAVTARTSEAHVRDVIADHELELWVILDTSSSLAFGTGRATKHEVAWSAAGAFAYLAGTGGNRIGAVRSTPSSGRVRPDVVPARSGAHHLGTVIAALHHAPDDEQPGDLAAAIDVAGRMMRRRGMAVVVSDFLGERSWERPLRAFAQRHEVIAVEVIDPRELELPAVGLISVVDPETGRRRLVDTRDAGVRERYREVAAERRADLGARLTRCGVDHLTLRTDRDWVIDFVRFVTTRRARRLAAARGGR
jgi:uncharacterized protein (DUF58 family)